jgi:hypothetical protein
MVFYHIISWKISVRLRVYSSSITKAAFGFDDFFVKKGIICAKTIFDVLYHFSNLWKKKFNMC